MCIRDRDNLYQQQAAAKEEVGKPFLYEEELSSKTARLVELDTLLNIDGKGQAHTESVVTKSTRPSVLDNLYQQQAAAKEEVGKPFLYEEELRSKNARLVELDTLLNIDGKGQAHAEAVVAKSIRTSVLDSLKRPATPRSTDKKPKQHEEVDVYKRQR